MVFHRYKFRVRRRIERQLTVITRSKGKDMAEINGENAADMDIDDLFADEEKTPTPTATPSNPDEDQGNEPSAATLAVTKRINEVREKTEKAVEARIAKDNGFETYAAMTEAKRQAKEDAIIKESGLDADEIEKVVTPLLKQRQADDPRFARLAELEAEKKAKEIDEQLASINETTGQQLTLEALPEATLKLWEKGIPLEQAYFATQGKALFKKGIPAVNNGTLTHLAPTGTKGKTTTRGYTEEEKAIYQETLALGDYSISDEELNKQTVTLKKEG
jgi:hypothetical protein